MKTLLRQRMFFWLILGLSFIAYQDLCFSAEQKSILMIDKQVLQLEDIWKAGNTNEYFLKARDIAKDIKANSTTNNMNKIAAKLFNNLVSKEINIGEVGMDGIGDLFAMNDLAWRLVSNGKVSNEEHRINARLLSQYLGKIRKEIIPNFKRRPVMRNVAPPIDVPRATAGMSPEVITNLVLRAQYEAAIRENRENNLMNSRQHELKSIECQMSKPIINYIIETFDAGGISSPLFTECINSASLNDKEKEEVLKKVGSKQPKQGKATGIDQSPIKNVK